MWYNREFLGLRQTVQNFQTYVGQVNAMVTRLRQATTRSENRQAASAREHNNISAWVSFATKCAPHLIVGEIQERASDAIVNLEENVGHIVAGKCVDGLTEEEPFRQYEATSDSSGGAS